MCVLLISKKNLKLRKPCSDVYPTIWISNVRSIKNKIDLCHQSIVSTQCDIAIITESWLNNGIPNTCIDIPNYKTIRQDRCDNSSHGGILCYLYKDYNFSQLYVDTNSLEIASFYIFKLKCVVVIIYHPYWGSTAMHDLAIDTIFSIISIYQSKFSVCDYIIAGDFNDLALHMEQVCHCFGLKNIIDCPTRNGKTLDCVYTSLHSHFSSATSLAPIGQSDHSVTICNPQKTVKQPITKINIRDYSPNNKAKFNLLFCNLDFSNLLLCQDMNYVCNTLLATLSSLIDHCFPIKKVSYHNNIKCPWINNEILLLIAKRNTAYQKGNIHIHKHLRNKIKTKLLMARKNYLSQVNKLSSSGDWKRIKKAVYAQKTENTCQFSPSDLNDFFCSVYVQPDFNIDFDLNLAPSDEISISVAEVTRALESIKKPGGIPNIPPWVFRFYSQELSPVITHIFNMSLHNGKIPTAFKCVPIKPIPKTPSPSSVEEHRPISLLSPLLKILEKFVIKRWLKHLCKEDIFYDQFAFVPLKGRGCTTALTLIYGKLLSWIDSGLFANSVFIDLTKAFDRVAVSDVLNCLFKYGASRHCLVWVYNYLTERCQKVIADSADNIQSSNLLPITSGTPQGGCLSPLLFAFLIASLQPTTSNSLFFKYADDLTVITWSHNVTEAESTLKEELDNISTWCTSHYMSINANKTALLHHHGRKKPQPPIVHINSHRLISQDSTKLLGVTIQANLKWNKHTDTCLAKASKLIFPLLQLRRSGANENILTTFYSACCQSILAYSHPCMCNMPASLMKKLIKLERRATHIMKCQPRVPISNVLQSSCSKLHVQVKGNQSHPLCRLLAMRSDTKTRSQSIYYVPAMKSSLLARSFIKYFT